MATVTGADQASNPFAAYNTTSTSASGGTANSTSTGSAVENRFLSLLVAQMKNQDPLNPLDNAQVTSQLAQINTVNGIEQLNQTLGKLMASNQSMQALQAASMVGHEVLAEGNSMALAAGSAKAGFDLPDGADHVTVTITSPSGLVVHRDTLDNLGAGVHTFSWDGKTDSGAAAADGNYTFSVAATTSGKSVTASPLSISRVDGVSNGTSGLTVNTSAGTLDWSKIKQVM